MYRGGFYHCALIFVVLFVGQSKAAKHNCEQKEKSLAGLDQAEDSLKKAKALYPDCDDDNEFSNSSECSKKDKSLAFIDVALDLVSEAKKNIPVCPIVLPDIKEEQRPIDCQEVMSAGHKDSGEYTIWPRSRLTEGKAVQVLCDMDTDGGGWTVIQRRGNFSIQENFYRNWVDYKNGFGNLSRDFWIGNDNIFSLSNQGAYALRFDLTDADGNSAYEIYEEFWIDDENSNYTLHVNKPRGTAGDSMSHSNGKMFSTKDRRNDRSADSCAAQRRSGFWHNSCTYTNANGVYRPGERDDLTCMHYFFWRKTLCLFSMEMKLKRL